MPRKICPLCKSGYLRYQGQKYKYGRIIKKFYKCSGCHANVTYDVEADTWTKEAQKK